MKTSLRLLVAAVTCSTLLTARAQMGGHGSEPSGPDLSGAMGKLFGENTAFSANTEMQARNGKAGEDMTVPGKLAFLDGKSRFEMDMSQMKSAKMPADAAAQMKQMGMDRMVMITHPEKKITYLIYPGLEACAKMPIKNPEAAKPAADFEMKVTELGKETVDGHACIKNKATVTDKEGKAHEFTVWNATDLKKFPVKIETTERDMKIVLLFKEVKFAKPEASQFEPPAAYKQYDSVMALIQQEMMKRMGGMQQ